MSCKCWLVDFILSLIILIAAFFTASLYGIYATIAIIVASIVILVHSLMHRHSIEFAARKKKRR